MNNFLSVYGADEEGDEETTAAEPGTIPTTSADRLVELFNKYYSGPGYGTKLEEARKKREGLLTDYQKTLEQASDVEGGEPSKAELYYRLSAAFADPGKTGSFYEALGRAGGVAAEYEKEKRLARRERALGGLKTKAEMQRLGIESAGTDIGAYRQLAEQELQDRTGILKEIAKAGGDSKPASALGKQAQDEGFTPGTPEFTERVKELARQSQEAGQSRIDALMGNLALSQSRLALAEGEATRKREALSPQEIKEVWRLDPLIVAAEQNLNKLQQALQYNELAFAMDPKTNAAEWAQYQTTQQRDPKNQRVVATNILRNLMKAQSLGSLKETFGGAGITDSERMALDALQGMSGASKEERKIIIKQAYEAQKARLAQYKDQRKGIYEGRYTRRVPETGAP
jgi:hypothetical protein